MGTIKHKKFYRAKETINKMKRQHTEWEKRYVNVMTDKQLISKIKSSYNSMSKNKKQKTLLNNVEGLIDIFPKKTYRWPTDIQVAKISQILFVWESLSFLIERSLTYNTSFRCTTQWFNIFIDYIPLTVNTK